MNMSELIISPKTRVGELLDTYPALEPVLMGMSPAFEKLRNPVLRKTVARVATLQQVSVVGGLKTEDLIRTLRSAIGQEGPDMEPEESGSSSAPSWFDKSRVVSAFDASELINAGQSPMSEILKETNKLGEGELFELTAPFKPAPIIDMLVSKGFLVYSIVNNQSVLTYFTRKSD
jgi:hypothetical protein